MAKDYDIEGLEYTECPKHGHVISVGNHDDCEKCILEYGDEQEKETRKSEAWHTMMGIAEDYGFIRFAYGGVALLEYKDREMAER